MDVVRYGMGGSMDGRRGWTLCGTAWAAVQTSGVSGCCAVRHGRRCKRAARMDVVWYDMGIGMDGRCGAVRIAAAVVKKGDGL